MRILEKLQKRAAYHQELADKYRVVLDLIVSDLEPEIVQRTTRKINGALRAHQVANETIGPARPRRTVKRRRVFKRGRIRVPDAVLQAIAAHGAPIQVDELTPMVNAITGLDSTRNSVSQAVYTLIDDGKLIKGKLKKGVYGLPDQKQQLRALEKSLPTPNSKAGRVAR